MTIPDLSTKVHIIWAGDIEIPDTADNEARGMLENMRAIREQNKKHGVQHQSAITSPRVARILHAAGFKASYYKVGTSEHWKP